MSTSILETSPLTGEAGSKRVRERRQAPVLLLILGSVTAAVALVPLVYLIVRVWGAGIDRIVDVLWRARTAETIGTSIALVVVVTALCLVIGIPTAWLVSRTNIPLRKTWVVLLALPLAVPSYVAAYAWIAQFPWFSGFWAAVTVLVLVSTPYIVLPTAAAFRSADPALEEVARSLGRSPLRAFLGATMPQAWPAAAAGALLVALYTLSDFGAVALFRVDAFTRVIYASYRGSFDRVGAAVLALLLVALAALLVLAERRTRGARRRWRSASGTQRQAVVVPLTGPLRVLSICWLTALTILALGVPIGSLINLMTRARAVNIDVNTLLTAALTSGWVSFMGAILAVLLALPVGIIAARYRSRSVHTIETLSYTGHALPGVVVGLSLVFFTLSVVPVAYQTVFTLAFAYAVLFLPKSVGATRSSTATVSPILEQTARTLGRGPLTAWASTTARLSAPGIAAGGLLVLLTAMKELPATLMLRPTGWDTLATEMWSRTEIAAYGEAAPYAIALIAIAALPAWLLSRAMTATAPVAMSANR